MGERWHVRAEMEWPDAHTTAVLAPGWRWSNTCFAVVNSDGTAADPQRRLVHHGGQIHTPVARDPDDLAQMADPLFASLRPVPNYRAAMRIAVRVPALRHDLALLKKVCDYTHRRIAPLWPRIDPLDALLDLGPKATPQEHRGAAARLTATIRARHYLVPVSVHTHRMNAYTVAAFTQPPTQPTASGRELTVALREAVDLRLVGQVGWVTFRCFASARDAAALRAAASLAVGWLEAACAGHDPAALLDRWQPQLPRQLPYRHDLERGWAETNFAHHTRAQVAAALAARHRGGAVTL